MNFLQSISFGEFQWTEIIYAMLGSFIGIFLPLWIDKLRASKQEKEARKKLLSGLSSELSSVKAQIEEYNTEGQYNIFSFSTFVWDSVVSAGMLTDILTDTDMHGDLLMEIYAELFLLRELHNDFCQQDFQAETAELADQIYGNIIQTRKDIHEKIVRYQAHIKADRK